MNHLKNFYSVDTQRYISSIRSKLDVLFQGNLLKLNPNIIPRSFIDMEESSENARELFTIENLESDNESYVLRPDHTRCLCRGYLPYYIKNISTKCFGSVFRKGPVGPYRWREFYQYDVDYIYRDVELRPLTKWIAFNSHFKTKVNDLIIRKSYFKEKSSLSEEELKSYSKEFYEKYPQLLEYENVELDPYFVRGWDYYKDLIYQTYFGNYSFAGGGVYVVNNEDYIGLGIGLGRLIKAYKEKGISDQLIQKDSLILLYNKSDLIPYDLLDQFEKHKIPYIIKKAKTKLIKEYDKINNSLSYFNFQIKNVVILDEDSIRKDSYNYRSKDTSYNNLNKSDLVKLFL